MSKLAETLRKLSDANRQIIPKTQNALAQADATILTRHVERIAELETELNAAIIEQFPRKKSLAKGILIGSITTLIIAGAGFAAYLELTKTSRAQRTNYTQMHQRHYEIKTFIPTRGWVNAQNSNEGIRQGYAVSIYANGSEYILPIERPSLLPDVKRILDNAPNPNEALSTAQTLASKTQNPNIIENSDFY